MTRVENSSNRPAGRQSRYWNTRLLRPDDAEAMAELSRRCFRDRADSVEFIRSRYTDSKGPASYVWAADADGKLIGTQAVTLLPFFVAGRLVTVGMFTAGMTHPDHRKRGVFRDVVEAAERFGFERDVVGLFTMPNDESYPTFQKSTLWRTLPDRPLRAMVIDAKRLLADKGMPRFVAGLGGWISNVRYRSRLNCATAGVSEVSSFDRLAAGLDRLADVRGRDHGGIMCRRGEEFLRWRFVENPSHRYRFFVAQGPSGMDGYLVTRTEQRMGTTLAHVIDWLVVPRPGVLESLFAVAASAAREDAASLLSMIASGGVESQRFAAFGFHVVPQRIAKRSFHTAYAVNPSRPELNSLFCSDAAWYLTLGDFDSI